MNDKIEKIKEYEKLAENIKTVSNYIWSSMLFIGNRMENNKENKKLYEDFSNIYKKLVKMTWDINETINGIKYD